jgi:hypothetical protein
MTWLFNRHTRTLDPAEVIETIDENDIACFQREWLPPIQRKVDELKATNQYHAQGVSAGNIEDFQWQWPDKSHDRTGQLEWGSYALRCDGLTQGLMFVNMLRRCRLESQLNQHMVYVDLMSTAPWNRPRLVDNPLYGGVGTVLLTEAILLSQSQEFEGRIGLHSLPGAESLYRDKFRMTCLGADPTYSGLLYFELTPELARALLRS